MPKSTSETLLSKCWGLSCLSGWGYTPNAASNSNLNNDNWNIDDDSNTITSETNEDAYEDYAKKYNCRFTHDSSSFYFIPFRRLEEIYFSLHCPDLSLLLLRLSLALTIFLYLISEVKLVLLLHFFAIVGKQMSLGVIPRGVRYQIGFILARLQMSWVSWVVVPFHVGFIEIRHFFMFLFDFHDILPQKWAAIFSLFAFPFRGWLLLYDLSIVIIYILQLTLFFLPDSLQSNDLLFFILFSSDHLMMRIIVDETLTLNWKELDIHETIFGFSIRPINLKNPFPANSLLWLEDQTFFY